MSRSTLTKQHTSARQRVWRVLTTYFAMVLVAPMIGVTGAHAGGEEVAPPSEFSAVATAEAEPAAFETESTVEVPVVTEEAPSAEEATPVEEIPPAEEAAVEAAEPVVEEPAEQVQDPAPVREAEPAEPLPSELVEEPEPAAIETAAPGVVAPEAGSDVDEEAEDASIEDAQQGEVLAQDIGPMLLRQMRPYAGSGADVGQIQARITNHLGYPSETSTNGSYWGNCISYAPQGVGSATEWVEHGEEALTGHGARSGFNCDGARMNPKANQSAIGFLPGPGGTLPLGGVASLGSIVHYNNPILVENEHFRGTIDVRTSALLDDNGAPVEFSFPWYMWETPNTMDPPDDKTVITVQSPETIAFIDDGAGGRRPYRMVVAGFGLNPGDCEAGNYFDEWWTEEGSTTTAEMCGQLTQVRTLEIVKQVELPDGFVGEIPGFTFDAQSTMTNLEGVNSFWDGNTFTLNPTATTADSTGAANPDGSQGEAQTVLVPNEIVTVTERITPGWQLIPVPDGIVCEGEGVTSTEGNDPDSSYVIFDAVEVDTMAKLAAKCTFTNRPVVEPLTIEKTVTDLTYAQNWTWEIVKTVTPDGTMTDPAASGTEFTYTVTVTPTEDARTDARYTTNLTITNPNAFPITGVELVDETCTVDEPIFDLAANETKDVTLTCSAAEVVAGTNTATITWTDPYGDAGSAEDSAQYNFDDATAVDGQYAEVTIADTFPEFAAQNPTATVAGKDGARTFTYTVTHVAPEGECRDFTNTATIIETGQNDTAEAAVCNQADLDATKNVLTELKRTYTWDIDKSVDDTSILVDPATGTASAEYTVVVTEGAATDSNWLMSGQITVTNPNQYKAAVVTVTDETSVGGVCTVDGGENATIPAGESLTFDYSCLFTEAPTSYDGSNTVTVTWADQAQPSTYTQDFTEDDWQLSEWDKSTIVSDTFPELIENYNEERLLTWSAEGTQHTFTYTHEFVGAELPAAGECVNVDNTAFLSTGGDDTVEVEICSGKLVLTKTADETTDLRVGEMVTYTFVATNEGTIPLTNVTIADTEFGGAGTLSALTCEPAQPATLQPGESHSCTATYTILEADLELDDITNVATATSDQTPPVTDEETITTGQLDLTVTKAVTDPTYLQDYAWTITKTVDPDGTMDNPAASGTTFGYTVTVTPTATDRHTATYTTVLTVTNPNTFPVNDVLVTDANCTVNDAGFTLQAGETRTITLECAAPSVDAPGTNQASITWTKPGSDVPGEASSNVVELDFADATAVPAGNATVDVADTFPEFADAYGEVSISATEGAQTYTYEIVHTSPEGECASFTNVAEVIGDGGVVLDEDDTAARVCNQAALAVEKNVTTSLDRTYAWSIDKDVDQTQVYVDPATGGASADYTVVVTEGAATDSNWRMTGQITVTNPNDYVDAVVTVSDSTTVGGECTVTGGEDVVLAAGETLTFDYTCVWTEQPVSYTGANIASVTWAEQDEPSTFSAPFEEAQWNLTELVKETTVSDTFPELAETYAEDERTLTWSAEGTQHTFTYTHEFVGAELPAAGECVTVDNTASLSTGGDDTVEVSVCEGSITLTKSATPTTYTEAGQVITYTLTAENTGSVALTDVTISDPKLGLTEAPCADELAPGETCSVTGTYTITQADMDAGAVDNAATTTGTDPGGNDVTDDDEETVTGASEPAIALVKVASPKVYSAVGDVITYTLTATNTGNVTLTEVTISDEMLNLDAAPCADSLAPGDSCEVTGTYTITQADLDAGRVDNTASTVGNPPNGDPVTASDDETVTAEQAPDIELVKTADVESFDAAGAVITYTLTATNTGNVTLTNVTITDPMTGLSELTCELEAPVTLAPGESLTCTATYVVTQADLDAGEVLNAAAVTADDPGDDPVEDDDEEEVPGDQKPGVELVKSSDATGSVTVGDLVVFSFTATNTGNVTLTEVLVSDPMLAAAGIDIVCPATELAPGASFTCVAEAGYRVTEADAKAGKVVNVATVTAEDPGGDPVTDDDEVVVPAEEPVPPAPVKPQPPAKPKPPVKIHTGAPEGSGPDTDLLLAGAALMTMAAGLGALAIGRRRGGERG